MVEVHKRPPAEQVISEIGYEATHNPMEGELGQRLNDTIGRFSKELQSLRAHFLLIMGLFVEDTMKDHPDADKDMLLRLAANEAQFAHTFIVRGIKRRIGEEIVPARMALVAYDIAEMIAGMEWKGSVGDQTFPHDGKSLRQLIADELAKKDDVA